MSLIFPRDAAYRRARAARRGELQVHAVYDAFLAAVERRFGVRPLWLEADRLARPGGSGTRPRLEVVVDLRAERRAFLGPRDTLERRTQRVLAELLVEHVGPHHLAAAFGQPPSSLPDDLLVLVPALEPVAIEEVHESVTPQQLDDFGASLGLGDRLWAVARLIGPPVVFLHTRDQVAAVLATGEADGWTDAYLELAAPYDELGYLHRGGTAVGVDSKQVLDEEFAGRLQHYWR